MQVPTAFAPHPSPIGKAQVRPSSQSAVARQEELPALQVAPASVVETVQANAPALVRHPTPRHGSPVGRQGTAIEGSQAAPIG